MVEKRRELDLNSMSIKDLIALRKRINIMIDAKGIMNSTRFKDLLGNKII